MSRLVVVLSFVTFIVKAALADTVISETGSAFSNLPLSLTQAGCVSWTSTTAFTSLSITARLTGFVQTGATGTAYLTTKIGSGTTAANQIASGTFTFPSSGSDTVLFSNLTLGPGTFFLTLAAPQANNSWLGGDAVNRVPPITGPGVAFAGQYSSDTRASYAPASIFSAISGNSPLLFTVTGTAVPEPQLSALLFVGAGVLLAQRIRQRNRD